MKRRCCHNERSSDRARVSHRGKGPQQIHGETEADSPQRCLHRDCPIHAFADRIALDPVGQQRLVEPRDIFDRRSTRRPCHHRTNCKRESSHGAFTSDPSWRTICNLSEASSGHDFPETQSHCQSGFIPRWGSRNPSADTPRSGLRPHTREYPGKIDQRQAASATGSSRWDENEPGKRHPAAILENRSANRPDAAPSRFLISVGSGSSRKALTRLRSFTPDFLSSLAA